MNMIQSHIKINLSEGNTVVSVAVLRGKFVVELVAADDPHRPPAGHIEAQRQIALGQFLVLALRSRSQVPGLGLGAIESTATFARVREAVAQVDVVFVAARQRDGVGAFRTALDACHWGSVDTIGGAGHSSIPHFADGDSRHSAVKVGPVLWDEDFGPRASGHFAFSFASAFKLLFVRVKFLLVRFKFLFVFFLLITVEIFIVIFVVAVFTVKRIPRLLQGIEKIGFCLVVRPIKRERMDDCCTLPLSLDDLLLVSVPSFSAPGELPASEGSLLDTAFFFCFGWRSAAGLTFFLG